LEGSGAAASRAGNATVLVSGAAFVLRFSTVFVLLFYVLQALNVLRGVILLIFGMLILTDNFTYLNRFAGQGTV
jgi:hypothetical protein